MHTSEDEVCPEHSKDIALNYLYADPDLMWAVRVGPTYELWLRVGH